MKNLLLAIFSAGLLYSCSGNEGEVTIEEGTSEEKVIDTFEERTEEIELYTDLLFKDSLNFNKPYAEKLLAAYEDYIKHHSFEAISLEYQFKAGELAKALNKPHVAIKHFNDLLERKPNHKNAPMALFYKAMIVGDMLNEDETAVIYYQEFIDNYPDHPFVESAKASIALQGKSLEEIVAGFEEKNS